jgi:hypothetical protein
LKKKITLPLITILAAVIIGATITPVFGIQEEIEQSFTYRIITGGDACNSFGAYRTVQINFKELENDEVESSLTIESVFFNSDLGVVGNGQIYQKVVRNIAEDYVQLPLQNNVNCVNGTLEADEKFTFFLNIKEKSGYPDLPPI